LEIARMAPQAEIAEATHEPSEWVNASRQVRALEDLHGARAAAFCGLGNPEGFRRSLQNLGLDLEGWRTFPDHHGYTKEDVESLRSWARASPAGTVVLTTQKDLVKIRLDRLADKELWALKIQLHVRCGAETLERKLSSACGLALTVNNRDVPQVRCER
jgi:tetraacyldisaccharide 4'-kinase